VNAGEFIKVSVRGEVPANVSTRHVGGIENHRQPDTMVSVEAIGILHGDRMTGRFSLRYALRGFQCPHKREQDTLTRNPFCALTNVSSCHKASGTNRFRTMAAVLRGKTLTNL
jgi:hypothetical protein